MATAKTTYVVTEGTQVHYQGTTYGTGEKVPYPEPPTAQDVEERDRWLATGWLEARPARKG